MQEVSRPRDVSGPGGFHPLARRFAATNPGSPTTGRSNAKPLSIGIRLTDHVDFDIARRRMGQQDSLLKADILHNLNRHSPKH
jgi:hypothetical protein